MDNSIRETALDTNNVFDLSFLISVSGIRFQWEV